VTSAVDVTGALVRGDQVGHLRKDERPDVALVPGVAVGPHRRPRVCPRRSASDAPSALSMVEETELVLERDSRAVPRHVAAGRLPERRRCRMYRRAELPRDQRPSTSNSAATVIERSDS
jgi:hypothetical protein